MSLHVTFYPVLRSSHFSRGNLPSRRQEACCIGCPCTSECFSVTFISRASELLWEVPAQAGRHFSPSPPAATEA